MTIHFAAAVNSIKNTMPAERARGWRKHPSNDNQAENGAASAVLDDVLRGALLHLSKHGLDAPAAARRNAEDALIQGDREAYDEWLAICRKFDRRAASALDRLSARVPERLADMDSAQSG